MAKAAVKQAGKEAGKPSKSGGIVTAAALTVLALAGGGVTGKLIAGRLQAASAAAEASEKTAEQGAGQGAGKGAAKAGETVSYAGDTVLRELAPIVANLAEPAETRIRLQVAIVFSKKAVELPDVLAGQITDDIVAFVKTLGVPQLQGASGLQALREDLNDRARARSEGRVREVVIENLVVQ